MNALLRFAWHLIRFNWIVVLALLVPFLAIGLFLVTGGIFGASGTATSILGLFWSLSTATVLLALAPIAIAVIFLWNILPVGKAGGPYWRFAFYVSLGVLATALFVTVIPIQNNVSAIPKLLLALVALILIAIWQKGGDTFVRIVKASAIILVLAWILSFIFPSAPAIADNSKALADKKLAALNDKLAAMVSGESDGSQNFLPGVAMCGATTPMCADVPDMKLRAYRGFVKVPLYPCWRTVVVPEYWEYNWWEPPTGAGFWASQWNGPIWIPYGRNDLTFRHVRTFRVCGQGAFTLELYPEGDAAPRPERHAPSDDEYEPESDEQSGASDESDTGAPGDMSCANATPIYIGSVMNAPVRLENNCFHLQGDTNHNFVLTLEAGNAEARRNGETEFTPLGPGIRFESGNDFLIRGKGQVRASRK